MPWQSTEESFQKQKVLPSGQGARPMFIRTCLHKQGQGVGEEGKESEDQNNNARVKKQAEWLYSYKQSMEHRNHYMELLCGNGSDQGESG